MRLGLSDDKWATGIAPVVVGPGHPGIKEATGMNSTWRDKVI